MSRFEQDWEQLIATGELKRRNKLQNEYAMSLAGRKLGLALDTTSRGRDLRMVDKSGKSYKVKARTAVTLKENTSFDFPLTVEPFDILVGVFFHPISFKMLGMFTVSWSDFVKYRRTNETTYRFRWRSGGPEREVVRWVR